MISFSDRALLALSDQTGLANLLAPLPGPPPDGLKLLIQSVYDLQNVTMAALSDLRVGTIEVQRPLFADAKYRGTLIRTQPSWENTDVAVERTMPVAPVWVDLVARISIDISLQVDAGGIESVVTRGLAAFSTLQEFRDQFTYMDLDAFMTRHQLVTVDDLRDAYDYLITEIKLTAPGPFDPNDPNNLHTVTLDLAVLIQPDIDLTASLRAAAQLTRIASGGVLAGADPVLGPPEHPFALAIVMPAAELANSGTSAAAVTDLFARSGVLALFTDPP